MAVAFPLICTLSGRVWRHTYSKHTQSLSPDIAMQRLADTPLKILPSGSPATHTKGHNPPHRRRYDNQWNQSFNAKETMLVSVFYSSGLHTWKEFHEYDTWQWQWNSLDRQMISMCLMFYWLYNGSSTRKSKEVWTARQFCFIPSLAECCPGTPASQP